MGEWLGADLEAQRTSIRGYRQTGENRVFCETCQGKLVQSSLVFLFEQRGSLLYNGLVKKSGAYHTSFNHQRSTKRPESNAKMCVNQRRENWRENESTHGYTTCCVLTLLVENRTEPEMGSRSELLLFISERKVGYTHTRKWRHASIE